MCVYCLAVGYVHGKFLQIQVSEFVETYISCHEQPQSLHGNLPMDRFWPTPCSATRQLHGAICARYRSSKYSNQLTKQRLADDAPEPATEAVGAPILVLDELDSGVRLGGAVGALLRRMTRSSDDASDGGGSAVQILCVSHLPQARLQTHPWLSYTEARHASTSEGCACNGLACPNLGACDAYPALGACDAYLHPVPGAPCLCIARVFNVGLSDPSAAHTGHAGHWMIRPTLCPLCAQLTFM